MFKALPPHRPPHIPTDIHPPDHLRRRALELVMTEIRHQPLQKARAFSFGLVTGIVLMASLDYGYHHGFADATLMVQEAMAAAPHHVPQGAH